MLQSNSYSVTLVTTVVALYGLFCASALPHQDADDVIPESEMALLDRIVSNDQAHLLAASSYDEIDAQDAPTSPYSSWEASQDEDQLMAALRNAHKLNFEQVPLANLLQSEEGEKGPWHNLVHAKKMIHKEDKAAVKKEEVAVMAEEENRKLKDIKIFKDIANRASNALADEKQEEAEVRHRLSSVETRVKRVEETLEEEKQEHNHPHKDHIKAEHTQEEKHEDDEKPWKPWLEEHDSNTGGMDAVPRHDDGQQRRLVQKVTRAARAFLNKKILECAASRPQKKLGDKEHIVKVHIAKGGLSVGVVAGFAIFVHGLEAERASGSKAKFNLEIRRRLKAHPGMVPESGAVRGEGAHDPLRKFMLHTVEPSPCATWTSKKYDEFAKLTKEQFVQTRLGYIAPKPEHTWVDDTVLTQQEMNSIPDRFDWTETAPGEWSKPASQGSCGDCWAWASATAISARLFIGSGKKVNPHVSPQWITSCSKHTGCSGGNAQEAYSAMAKADGHAVDAKCYPFSGKDASQGAKCGINADTGEKVPENCYPYYTEKIEGAPNYSPYVKNIKGTGDQGIQKIQKEIMENGPAFIAFDVMGDFGSGREGASYTSGIYEHRSGAKRGGHAVTLVGWGEDSGIPYWKCQNSWGKHWGVSGFFKIRRGTNEVGIEGYGISAGRPNLVKLCANKCVNGALDKKCKCGCRYGWGNAECSSCVLKCDGPNYTGNKVMTKGGKPTEKCQCECKAGFFGDRCSLKAKVSSQEVQSGEEFDLSLAQPEDRPIIQQGDKIAVFAQGVTPWEEKNGWHDPAVKSIEFKGDSEEASATLVQAPKFGDAAFTGDLIKKMKLYNPGEYQIYLIKWLGMNEFNQDKGFSTKLVSLGAVSVADCKDECVAAPPVCFDNKKYGDYMCKPNRDWMQHCGKAKALTFNFQEGPITLAQLCPKSCNLCGPGPRPVPPPPPAPPPGTGPVPGKCVPKHSLGKCAQCLTHDQCGPMTPGGKNRFCCPYMKKCVIDGHESCTQPVANCQPVCRGDGKKQKCEGCKDTRFPNEWQKDTCVEPAPSPPSPPIAAKSRGRRSGGGGRSGGAGGSKGGEAAGKCPAKHCHDYNAGWCRRFGNSRMSKFCKYRTRRPDCGTLKIRDYCGAACDASCPKPKPPAAKCPKKEGVDYNPGWCRRVKKFCRYRTRRPDCGTVKIADYCAKTCGAPEFQTKAEQKSREEN